MLPSPHRFHGHNSLRYVYANGKAVRTPALTLKSVKNDRRSHSRISVVVSKKVCKGALGRNRIRRRVYEHVRQNIDRLNDVYDIVLIVTSAELKTMPAPELAELIEQVFERADLYKTA